MKEPTKNVFVIWDQSSNDARILLQGIARRPPKGFRVSFSDPGKQGGDPLTENLIPQIQAADQVFIISPSNANASAAISFEIGLALGFSKPLAFGAPLGALNFELVFRQLFKLENFGSYLGSLELFRKALENEGSWYHIPVPIPIQHERVISLCPSRGEGEVLHEELTAARPDWSHLDLIRDIQSLPHVLSASQLLWVITSFTSSELWYPNAANALAAGIFYAQHILKSGTHSVPSLHVLRSRHAPAIRAIQKLERTFEDLDEFAALLRSEDSEAPNLLLRLETLQIRNFKSIEDLTLDFTAPSSLDGDWTCIAGINGAGKSSILQALSMVLLGEKLVAELGSERIKRVLRRAGSDRLDAEITVVLRDGHEQQTLYLPLSEQGLDRSKLFSHPEYSRMPDLWERLQKQVLVAYGATRNLSDFKDTRYSSLSPHVQRQMTLFDPLTQIANVDVLLEGKQDSAPVLATLRKILIKVLQGELAASASPQPDRISFTQGGTDVEAIELPDGFRSTVAWLADLCAAWHQTASPEEKEEGDPGKIRGIVLLDEIDLHLHPSLQRALVPRLREVLKNVQFIVTTHSPLVLSSFDRAELVVLDRDSEQGIKELDRQIFAFSSDQVYEWLMGTPAQSEVIEGKLGNEKDPDLALYLYQSEDRNEEQAQAALDKRQELVDRLRRATAGS